MLLNPMLRRIPMVNIYKPLSCARRFCHLPSKNTITTLFSQILPTAFLELLPTPTRTGIISAYTRIRINIRFLASSPQ